MQNNATELTHRLLRALDANYNVIDMATVTEIVSLLEKVAITKELLETTRLGKHVNELRRKTNNDSLSRRAKLLVKKWRNLVLPEPNGKPDKRVIVRSPPEGAKRPRLNGQSELELLSDNSNSGDVKHKEVIVVNSDSNSSMMEAAGEPKRRGRKKGSKNHKNLLDEAETSFSNKLAVSRGNSKVKTTQELVLQLQNKGGAVGTSPVKAKEDLNLRAAKLTERVSIIDQKLNTNANRYRRSALQKITIGEKNERVIESGSVINDKTLIQEEEVIVVDDVEAVPSPGAAPPDPSSSPPPPSPQPPKVQSLSVEEALALLPPLDRSVLEAPPSPHPCTCALQENKDFAIESEELGPRFEFVEAEECLAREEQEAQARLRAVTVEALHTECIAGVNGNWGLVPNVDNVAQDVDCETACENYKKYSESGGEQPPRTGEVFREWHEVLDRPSYNGEIFKMLPYVIID